MPTTPSPKIVLASGSPRRKELLTMLGVPFTIITSDADETITPGQAPAAIVQTLALRKAEAVLHQAAHYAGDEPAIIIGSDTIVVCDDEVLGKPVNKQDSTTMLTKLRGRTHLVYTGVACIGTGELVEHQLVRYQATSVTMRDFSDQELAAYIATGEPQDKAGSYAVQGLGSLLVERIDGCYFNVVGLPLSLLGGMLKEFEVRIL